MNINALDILGDHSKWMHAIQTGCLCLIFSCLFVKRSMVDWVLCVETQLVLTSKRVSGFFLLSPLSKFIITDFDNGLLARENVQKIMPIRQKIVLHNH